MVILVQEAKFINLITSKNVRHSLQIRKISKCSSGEKVCKENSQINLVVRTQERHRGDGMIFQVQNHQPNWIKEAQQVISIALRWGILVKERILLVAVLLPKMGQTHLLEITLKVRTPNLGLMISQLINMAEKLICHIHTNQVYVQLINKQVNKSETSIPMDRGNLFQLKCQNLVIKQKRVLFSY